MAGRIVHVAGEPIAGEFRSRHVFCDVLLRGFTILEKLKQFLKILCFFYDRLVLVWPVLGALRVPGGDE